MMNKTKSTFLVIFQFLLILNIGQTAKMLDGADKYFESFLHKTMMNYSIWLKENHHDPTSPVENVFVLNAGAHRAIYLWCSLSNIFLNGHSESFNEVVKAKSNFVGHVIGFEREVPHEFELHGDLNCSGAIKARYDPELGDDLPFNGQGKFVVTVMNTLEILTMENIGITSDFKLEISHSWLTYMMSPDRLTNVELKALWDESLISSKYIDIIQKVFGNLFLYAYFSREHDSNPLSKLLERYLHENLENLDLRSIIPIEDLPPIYLPTSSSTVKPSTSSSTVKPSTSSSTVKPPTSSTTINPPTSRATTNPPTSTLASITTTTTMNTPTSSLTTQPTSTCTTMVSSSSEQINSTPSGGVKMFTVTWLTFIEVALMLYLTF